MSTSQRQKVSDLEAVKSLMGVQHDKSDPIAWNKVQLDLQDELCAVADDGRDGRTIWTLCTDFYPPCGPSCRKILTATHRRPGMKGPWTPLI